MIGSKDLLDMICTEAIENYERREDCGECAGSGTAIVPCRCPKDTASTCCFEGTLYGPCESEFCYGACEEIGPCSCPCHAVQPAPAGPAPERSEK